MFSMFVGLCQTSLMLLCSQETVVSHPREEEREGKRVFRRATRALARSLQLACTVGTFFGDGMLLLRFFPWGSMGTLGTILAACLMALTVPLWLWATQISWPFIPRLDSRKDEFMKESVGSLRFPGLIVAVWQLELLLTGYGYTAEAPVLCWPLEDRCKLLAGNPKWAPGF